ncbi:hypothetical protein QWY81_17400 [Polaribacter undariae]|uniref:Uncharacterized protein n=1 Tax=Polaribacter sejongensis TaxID=985043 RepID=A0AAJ1QZR3_9FLAO|nr:hypothetical protein [Polaribacter undariae]MDN3621246.1 hypothetical protein [Polaribacter undariae]UWD33275.1 hypothetical protein NQP51_06220 [Polaribacter undariae]
MTKNQMFYLQTIYHNNIGATYFFKDNLDPDLSMNKIQIIIGDIALILEDNEIFSFLEVIESVKMACKCDDCNELKQITCNTSYTKLIFKSTRKNINELEDLIKGTIFEIQLNSLIN